MTLAVLLLESALRAALLGLGVWALLKLSRLRDARAETLIWTATLAASLAMPLLCRAMPGLLAVPLPAFAAPDTSSPQTIPGAPVAHAWWSVSLLLWLYALVAAFAVARLAIGLFLTIRLYRAAIPVAAPWADGIAVRVSPHISGPICFGGCILLPADCRDWPEAKRIAVLAHEQSHVRRGDFFIQFLAGLHRALFWFSPFAWWLQARLCALAEAASDEAAISQLNDRATYAEILLEVSRRAHNIPSQLAMAKGPDMRWRVDRILLGAPERRLHPLTRLLAAGAILPAALLVAGAHAAVPPQTLVSARHSDETIPLAVAADSPVTKPVVPAARPHPSAAPRRAKTAKAPAAPPEDEVSYNPRALLEDPAAAVLPALVPTTSKKKGGSDAAIILNLNNVAGSGD